MSTQISRLTDQYIIKQAQQLINEFGEFYPFGAGIDSVGEIRPINVYFGEEYPSSVEVIKEYEIVLKNVLLDGSYVTVAICSDVLASPPNLNKKMDALEIRCQSNDKTSVNVYIPYYRNEKDVVVFLDAYEEKGTLNLI